MAQHDAWEKEYKNPTFLTKKDAPQKDVLKTFSQLEDKYDFILEDRDILDLGCGVGRNSNYLASLNNAVWGVDISNTAIESAQEYALKEKLNVTYQQYNIGTTLPFPSAHFDLIIDITSSNSLTENERATYLKETQRVLRSGGYFIVKGLLKDGDKNAKNLIREFPGKEKDTYTIPQLNITERVFSKSDFANLYGEFFKILSFETKTSYTRMNNRVYKRNFFMATLTNK